MTIDLGKRQDHGGWAKYLPAISGFFTKHLGNDKNDPNFTPVNRIPERFEHGIQGMNFLEPEKSYYHYPYALYSVGHAERRLDRCDEKEHIIHKRDKEKTIMIGDSGGFQIATGIIKMDWATAKTETGDKLRGEILRWLEHTADWSMTLDVPPFAGIPPLNKKTGLSSPDECLDISLHNLHYFVKNRVPGATKFLNVLSGNDKKNSKEWYEVVKHFSDPDSMEAMGYDRDRTLEGYALAGVNTKNMPITLERLLNLRDDGLLEGKDWIHVLGVGRLDWACHLTAIERVLRKYHNPNVCLSFDASSPFVAAGAYGLLYDYNHFKSDQLTYSMGRGVDNKSLQAKKLAMPFQSPIMDRLYTSDFCNMGPNDLNGHGKIGKTSWSSTTYALAMSHNVYNHIQAVQEINRLADIEYAIRSDIDYKDWYHMRANKKNTNLSEFVPNAILFFNDFVNKLFDPENKDPYQMIEDNRLFLEFISFGNKKAATTFGSDSMWGEIEDTSAHIPSVEDMASMDVDPDIGDE